MLTEALSENKGDSGPSMEPTRRTELLASIPGDNDKTEAEAEVHLGARLNMCGGAGAVTCRSAPKPTSGIGAGNGSAVGVPSVGLIIMASRRAYYLLTIE